MSTERLFPSLQSLQRRGGCGIKKKDREDHGIAEDGGGRSRRNVSECLPETCWRKRPPRRFPLPQLPQLHLPVDKNSSVALRKHHAYLRTTNCVTEAKFGEGISGGGGVDSEFGSVTVTSPTRATARITIAEDADLDERNVTFVCSRIDSLLRIRTRQERFALKDGFTVAPAPPQFTLSPSAGRQRQALTITITGQNTRFRQESTQASFGAGISVGDGKAGEFGSVTVNSPTQATARIVIDEDADPDDRTVRIRTADAGDARLSAKDAFTGLCTGTDSDFRSQWFVQKVRKGSIAARIARRFGRP